MKSRVVGKMSRSPQDIAMKQIVQTDLKIDKKMQNTRESRAVVSKSCNRAPFLKPLFLLLNLCYFSRISSEFVTRIC